MKAEGVHGLSRHPWRRGVQLGVMAALLVGGLWMRTLPSGVLRPMLAAWWPWPASHIATLYFTDGRFLVPVSRRLPPSADVPRATLKALFDGPGATTGLGTAIPPELEIRSVIVVGDVAHVDLSEPLLPRDAESRQARAAIIATMTAVPGITSVTVSAEEETIEAPVRRTPLLYYASGHGLAAVPTSARSPQEAIATYMAGPPAPTVTGLPADVRLLGYEHDHGEGIVSVQLSYTPSVRELAIRKPDIMRTVLLGLIASLTEFPDVRAVRLDFEGHARLGMGQCSDLLGAPQPRPRLLNDERLLGQSWHPR